MHLIKPQTYIESVISAVFQVFSFLSVHFEGTFHVDSYLRKFRVCQKEPTI